jgi:hypothetical protein
MLADLNTVLSPFDKELMALTRNFIQGPRVYEATVEEIHAALVQSNLVEFIAEGKSPEHLLESLGIALIINLFQPLGPGRVAITPSASDMEAKRLLGLVSQADYHLFRRALGIKYHWVLQLNTHEAPDLNNLMTQSMYWYHDQDENPPECSVIAM